MYKLLSSNNLIKKYMGNLSLGQGLNCKETSLETNYAKSSMQDLCDRWNMIDSHIYVDNQIPSNLESFQAYQVLDYLVDSAVLSASEASNMEAVFEYAAYSSNNKELNNIVSRLIQLLDIAEANSRKELEELQEQSRNSAYIALQECA